MNEEKLVVLCDACRRPIGDGDGYLHIDHAEIVRHRSYRPGLNGSALTVTQLLAAPDLARWQAHHVDCYPESDSVDYDVAVADVRTWPLLVATTARLMGKTWLPVSDWYALLAAISTGDRWRVTRDSSVSAR